MLKTSFAHQGTRQADLRFFLGVRDVPSETGNLFSYTCCILVGDVLKFCEKNRLNPLN